MNSKGLAGPQPHILPEFNSQTVGSKRVQINLKQKNQITLRDFLPSSLGCEALAKTYFGGER